ncbi:MAG: hypothetical protein ACI30M_08000 [Muribaculaceae bacterium]
MNTAMAKTLTALFLSAAFLMLMMTSCMSDEEKRLDNLVNIEKKEMPKDIGYDVKAVNVTYSTTDSLVTYTMEVEPGMIASTLEHTGALLKQGIIISIKTDENNEFREAVIGASASIKYNFFSDGKELTSFVITPDELK